MTRKDKWIIGSWVVGSGVVWLGFAWWFARST